MPRIREDIDEGSELEVINLEKMQEDIELVYSLGIVFLEMLNDVQTKRGNYHTVGANRLGVKYLVTSNCAGAKFYAGGSRVRDLASELLEEFNWPLASLQEALGRATKAAKAPLPLKR